MAMHESLGFTFDPAEAFVGFICDRGLSAASALAETKRYILILGCHGRSYLAIRLWRAFTRPTPHFSEVCHA
jgi:hypothetical protein